MPPQACFAERLVNVRGWLDGGFAVSEAKQGREQNTEIHQRLRRVREVLGYASIEVASLLGVGKLRVDSWESGKRTPSELELRELALVYGTGLEDLLGEGLIGRLILTNQFNEKPDDDLIDSFWGYVGIDLPGSVSTVWHPISRRNKEPLLCAKYAGSSKPGWAAIYTLSNRYLLVNLQRVVRIRLVNEAGLSDKIDLSPGVPPRGFSQEFCRRLKSYLDCDGNVVSRDQSFWDPVRRYMDSAYASASRRNLDRNLNETCIVRADGSLTWFDAEDRELAWLLDGFLHGTESVVSRFVDKGYEEVFYESVERLAMIDMPLLNVLDAYHSEFIWVWSIPDTTVDFEISSLGAFGGEMKYEEQWKHDLGLKDSDLEDSNSYSEHVECNADG